MTKTPPKLALKLALTLGLCCIALPAQAGHHKPKPEPTPPPPPVAIMIPPRPTPPNYAPTTLHVPPVGAGGLFDSVDRNISPAQTVWNLRSAWNVAALSCGGQQRDEITAGYLAFLKKHRRGLALANRTADSEYRKRFGAHAIREREAQLTRVYNHFAMPALQEEFCNAVAAVGRDSATLKLADLTVFAARYLPTIEAGFDDFWHRYVKYQADLADWNAHYGPPVVVVPPPPLASTLPAAQQ